MLKSSIYFCLFGLLAGVRSFQAPDELSNYAGIIYDGKTPVCIGAIVAPAANKRVSMVTAAHCVRGASNLLVSLGGKNGRVNHVMVHPFYKPPLQDYDIAVLKTEIEEGADKLAAISLSDKENEIPKELNIIEMKTPQKLEGVAATKEERQACQSKHGSKIRISTKMICAQSGSNVLDGSPLYYIKDNTKIATKEYVLVGVASYSLNSSLPKIFTNTANPEIYKFIDKYI